MSPLDLNRKRRLVKKFLLNKSIFSKNFKKKCKKSAMLLTTSFHVNSNGAIPRGVSGFLTGTGTMVCYSYPQASVFFLKVPQTIQKINKINRKIS